MELPSPQRQNTRWSCVCIFVLPVLGEFSNSPKIDRLEKRWLLSHKVLPSNEETEETRNRKRKLFVPLRLEFAFLCSDRTFSPLSGLDLKPEVL